MDKEKISRKKVLDSCENLPAPPLNPQLQQQQQQQQQHQQHAKLNTSSLLPDAFRRLLDYRDRETTFLKNLNETITSDCKKIKSESDKLSSSVPNSNICETDHEMLDKSPSATTATGASTAASTAASIPSPIVTNTPTTPSATVADCELLRDECDNFITPLLNRTGPSISAALVTYDAFEQLNRLHGLLDQMLVIQEQNYQMRRYLRDVRTLCELKKLQKKDPIDLLNEGEISDTELDLDNHVSLLSTILAAGNSASTKRSSAKRQRERSKSVMVEDIHTHSEKSDSKPSTLRRQSAFSDNKGKVSKWTKVKAAFKWERANVPALIEGKSSDSGIGLTPVNNEVARYLRVPSVPCTGSSADSVLSSSSGHLLSGGSVPATPGTISSASSIEDVGAIGGGNGGGCVSEEIRHRSSKNDSANSLQTIEEQGRRSRSLDGDAVIGPSGQQSKNKTPWKKVKDIIQTHRGSFKNKPRSRSIKSSESVGSRDASPCESIDTISNQEDRNDGQNSPSQKNVSSSPQDQESGSLPSSPSGTGLGGALSISHEEIDLKTSKSQIKGTRKSRMLSEFECLPENVIVDSKVNPISRQKQPPSPLNLSNKHDSSDAEFGDLSYSPTVFLKSPNRCLKPKNKSITPGNSSVPSSPSRHSEFFGEFESEDLSSGDFSEPTTPQRRLSSKCSLQMQQEEINEKYFELREKLSEEFERKRQEWDKIRSACSSSTSCAYHLLSKEDVIPAKSIPPKLLEENLSADFKKKLHKWRVKKQISVLNAKDPQISPTKENEPKKIDWNLWKTGQLKLEGQGLTPLPEQKDLPEDFQKKLEQWKKMKESNMVHPYNSQDSLKRQSKSNQGAKGDGSKKSKEDDKSDREKQRPERDKLKSHEKEKSEKLSKLKAIVAEPRVKEIQVQTSAGVMKFEGISRKFTRKLYEWEKARGIGPESSTFALLHPGYRPLDVGNATQEVKSHEASPTLGRSLSLDSISPHPSVPSISHQTSSLSLNDMDELKDTNEGAERCLSSDLDMDGKEHIDEPEAVIVEVEDDIIETAAPLLTAIPMVEQQTPVYKYEVPCQEICPGKKENIVQKELRTRKLSSQTITNVNNLKSCINDPKQDFNANIQHVQCVLSSLKDSLPELERYSKDGSPQMQDTFGAIRKIIFDVTKMLESLSKEEACSKGVLSEKTAAIETKLRTLEKSINVMCKYIESTKHKIPEINVTSDDGVNKNVAIVSSTPTIFHSQIVVNQPKIFIGGSSGPSPPVISSPSHTEERAEKLEISEIDFPIVEATSSSTVKKISRNLSNGSKKKTRLRKMGSRQNSKTESDTTSDEDAINIVLEAPRRTKRKTSRAKKSLEDDKKSATVNDDKKDETNAYTQDDIVYVLKIKPGKVIEQHEKDNDSTVLISPTESCVQLMEVSQESPLTSTNVFVKTKKKIFTPIEETSRESKTFVIRELESSSASDKNEKELQDLEKLKGGVKNLPPIPQSPTQSQKRFGKKSTPPKEPSPSIRLMIAKYNQKLASNKTNRSPISSGSCSPSMRSPTLEHRVKGHRSKYQKHIEYLTKSASAGNIRQNINLIHIDLEDGQNHGEDCKILKSSSLETMPCNWNGSDSSSKESSDFDRKPPLACDSLKLLGKNRPILKAAPPPENFMKKDHIYRKHKEKPTSLFTKATAKRIGTKCARGEFELRRSLSCSTGEVNQSHYPPDRSDNTQPKIIRKLEGKNIEIKPRSFSIEPWIPSASAPTTPQEDAGRPKTPISERALKLQRAKDDFLRGHLLAGPSSLQDEILNEDVWNKRLSQMSVGSESSNENCILLKSASVGVIDSGSTDNEHLGGYVSLPRSISRSGKFSNKFGFSTLASKFRKVRMRRGSREQSRMNAVSELCRQSISIEVTPEETGNLSQSDKNSLSDGANLSKSGSTQMLGFSSLFRKNDKNKLNKSKSSINVGNDPVHQK